MVGATAWKCVSIEKGDDGYFSPPNYDMQSCAESTK